MPVEYGRMSGAHARGHHELFERRVPGALADPVDRAFDLASTGSHRSDGVGDGQPEVVVAMRAERRVTRVRHPLNDCREEAGDLVRRGIAHGVRQVDRRASCGNDFFDDPAQEIHVAARRILRRELDVVGIATGAVNGRDRGLEARLPGHAELAFEVQVRGRDEHVDAASRRRCERPSGAVDVRRVTAGKRGNHRTADVRGDHPDGLGVGVRGDGKPCFDDICAEGRQLARHLQLFVRAHRESGGLFAVPERRVENRQSCRHRMLPVLVVHSRRMRVQFIVLPF